MLELHQLPGVGVQHFALDQEAGVLALAQGEDQACALQLFGVMGTVAALIGCTLSTSAQGNA